VILRRIETLVVDNTDGHIDRDGLTSRACEFSIRSARATRLQNVC
jgi:hypothetical protein